LNEKLSNYLNSVTLQDLISEHLAKSSNVAVLVDHRRAGARKSASLPL
jgi:hypothetical protein